MEYKRSFNPPNGHGCLNLPKQYYTRETWINNCSLLHCYHGVWVMVAGAWVLVVDGKELRLTDNTSDRDVENPTISPLVTKIIALDSPKYSAVRAIMLQGMRDLSRAVELICALPQPIAEEILANW